MSRFNFLKRNKLFLLSIAMVVAMISGASLLSFGILGDADQYVEKIDNLIAHYKLFFFFWHILLIFLVYFCWGNKIDCANKHKNVNHAGIKKQKRIRWIFIGGILLVDLFVFGSNLS